MDEEKTIDEAVEEQADEMKEFEPVAFDEVIKETEPERKDAPILRDAPEPADMNMIHKHLDNFLAMLCGETPIDDNVRTSTEYWLKRLADGNGGSTKKIYRHTITLVSSSGTYVYSLTMDIFNEDKTEFTLSTLKTYFDSMQAEHGTTIRFPITGALNESSATTIVAYIYVTSIVYGMAGITAGGSLNTINFDWDAFFANATEYDVVYELN